MRIVCLSAESANICARLGAWEEVVAVSAFAPQEGWPRRPVIGGFSTCDVERVAALEPDLVITFSDVQAELAGHLIRAGCTVLATNQRTLREIPETIQLIGGAIRKATEAAALVGEWQRELAALASADGLRPRVYFEEWPDPLISGIAWVGELIEHVGGTDIFAARRGRAARERCVQPAEIIAADPQLILASWCGQRVDPAAIRARPGFDCITAVREDQIHALDSGNLLQPGPRVLAGAREIRRLLEAWRQRPLRA